MKRRILRSYVHDMPVGKKRSIMAAIRHAAANGTPQQFLCHMLSLREFAVLYTSVNRKW